MPRFPLTRNFSQTLIRFGNHRRTSILNYLVLMVCLFFLFVQIGHTILISSPFFPSALTYHHPMDDGPSYTLIHCPKPVRSSSSGEGSPAERLEAIASLIGDLACDLDDIESSDDYLSLGGCETQALEAQIEIISLQSQLNWASKCNKGYERLNHLQAMEDQWTNQRCEVPEWLL